MFDPFDLLNNLYNIGQEALWIMIMENVHIHTLVATGHKGLTILFCLDTPSNSCKYQGAWVDCLQVTTWHLKYNRICSWHDRHNLGSTLDTTASLVLLGFIQWHFELWISLVVGLEKEKTTSHRLHLSNEQI